ncbi:chromosome partitioning protein [Pseudobutyrivibrio sp. 49]|uniref:ParA family protein n=1 Tax=Pseudobutyrivibrio sp. 49 TaxID=1855344 RepID=UPI000887145F|nr:AAA family ATPase [Pseudobutyrivibrio sp. 49]SDI56207.1 chromosome partitioning protein [Pseudobutyrivibrio sp. 49]
MAKTIIFGNQKGGCGKSTDTINVSAQLSKRGYKVLMVDSDPQASLTIISGLVPEDYEGQNLASLLYDTDGALDIHKCIVPLNEDGTLSILPTDITMANGDLEFVSRPGNDRLIKNILKKIDKEYDYICIDCLPSLGIISINDIAASDYIIGCVEPGYQALKGLEYYCKVISRAISLYEYDTKFFGIIITKIARNNDSKDITELLENEYNVLAEIPNSVEVTKGEIDGIPVSIRKPAHISSLEYSKVADAIIAETTNN